MTIFLFSDTLYCIMCIVYIVQTILIRVEYNLSVAVFPIVIFLIIVSYSWKKQERKRNREKFRPHVRLAPTICFTKTAKIENEWISCCTTLHGTLHVLKNTLNIVHVLCSDLGWQLPLNCSDRGVLTRSRGGGRGRRVWFSLPCRSAPPIPCQERERNLIKNCFKNRLTSKYPALP